jgi:hypothetical protein
VSFTVPESGGAISVPSSDGSSVEFSFPASAAGLEITLTPSSATSLGRAEGEFAQVIDMQPHGTVFEDPVLVRPSGLPVVLHFSSQDPEAAPEVLPMNANGDALEIRHFSRLAQMPEASCVPTQTWDRAPNCVSLFTTMYVELTCTTSDNCLETRISCCTLPGETCGFGSNSGRYEVVRNEKKGADGYCHDGEGGRGGAGGTGGIPNSHPSGGAGGVAGGGTGGVAGSTNGGTAGVGTPDGGHGGTGASTNGGAGGSHGGVGGDGGAAGGDGAHGGTGAGGVGGKGEEPPPGGAGGTTGTGGEGTGGSAGAEGGWGGWGAYSGSGGAAATGGTGGAEGGRGGTTTEEPPPGGYGGSSAGGSAGYGGDGGPTGSGG